MKRVDNHPEAYQVKITLLMSRPPIWRRLIIPGNMTLARWHDVLQIAMGWQDCHLHEFLVGRERFGVPDPDEMMDPDCADERKTCVGDVLVKKGARIEYTYDFGDGWEHEIVVEKIFMPQPGDVLPVCTGGERHCPPEDCGGPFGYLNFLKIMANPRHREHAAMLLWAGGSFDADSFSLEAVNRRLRKKFGAGPKVKAKPATARRPRKVGPVAIPISDKVTLALSDADRLLIIEGTLAPEDLTGRLQAEPGPYRYTLGELEELQGFVAAEANHTPDKKLAKGLNRIFDLITGLMETHSSASE